MHIRDFLILFGFDLVSSVFAQGHQQAATDALGALAGRGADGRCGHDFGKCSNGDCCSAAGYCGTSAAHCRSPDCQIDFGHCDGLRTPDGPPTTDIPRPHNGKVPYGPHLIRSCTVPGTVALTFDDGPHRYTSYLLDLLDRYNAKATFFITGINNGKGQIDDPKLPWLKLIQRMQLTGHQIASHSWSHQDLRRISPVQRRDQMIKNEAALRNILGAFPTYMRPPYSSCDAASGCLNDMEELGYHVVLFDLDTSDYQNDNPNDIQKSKDIFDRTLASFKASDKSWLAIAHDVHEQTVHNLTEHMLKKLSTGGYRAVTVGECLGDPPKFWYRHDSRDVELKGSSDKKPISPDGACGVNFTCAGSSFGSCCSRNNLCGNSTDHCVIGCQTDAGHCSPQNAIIPPTIADNFTSPFEGNRTNSAGVLGHNDNTTHHKSEAGGKAMTSEAASIFHKTSFVTVSMLLALAMALFV